MKNIKNYLYLLLLIAVIFAVAAFARRSISANVFTVINDSLHKKNGLAHLMNISLDDHVTFLPSIENKTVFDAVDDFSIFRRKDVRKYVYLYLKHHRLFVKRSIAKSGLYMDDLQQIKKQFPNVPEDILLLPLLESGFNPFAVSRSKAVGLWQFMQATSTALGLRTNKWIDERRNIKKSTHAALRHLKNLYSIYKNWELALAAYNGGGVQINKAIKKHNSRDLWKLRHKRVLTNETREYVPRYIALLLIYKYQSYFNIKHEIKGQQPVATTALHVSCSVNIKKLSNILGLSFDILKNLNPELKGGMLTSNILPLTIQVPPQVYSRFKDNLQLNKTNKFPVCSL